MEAALFPLYLLAFIRPRWIAAAVMLHAALVVSSAVRSGRIPLIGMHDTLGFLAFSIAALFLVLRRRRGRDLITFVTILLILLLLAGSMASPASTGPLPPVLRTLWFELHVILSFVAYGLFAVGAVFGIDALVRHDHASEREQYRLLLSGYVLFSAAMIFGGIWAFYAWGTYWLWTPKELWTTIVWFWYSLYLHARLVRRWSGARVIWIGIAGFLIVMFTYAGVGLLMKSSHEF